MDPEDRGGSAPPAAPAGRALSRAEIERVCMSNLLASRSERVWFKDLDSRILLVTAGWLASVGSELALDDVIGKTDFDFFSRPHAEAALADERRVIATGEPLRDKIELETFEDRPDAWVATTKLPLRDAGGRIVGTWGFCNDATPQVEAQQALAASRENAERGLSVVIELIDGLTELDGQTAQVAALLEKLTASELHDISSVSTVIEDVAARTKLLALNAAIEAARAGEHGRGFAIVAEEVRRLAEQTAEQTAQIAETIGRIETQIAAIQLASTTARGRAAAGAAQAGVGREALEELRALLDASTARLDHRA
ncbi:MAG TPA: methyl-accepting chemotaxis protein [Solirubrobacteraceae bacterium]|nr:methyl-accepting chemotaxis protein [Solirubrobacteraceae bacterium]